VSPDLLRVRRFELLFDAMRITAPAQPFSVSYLAHLAASSHLMEGALETLQALHGRYHIAILTNGLKAVQRPRLERSAIRDFVSEIIISEEVGVAKPAPGIFDAAFARMGEPARSEVLMIGDNLVADIQGAADYGLDTCWFNSLHLPRPAEIAITYEIGNLSELRALLIRD
jgi:YjjG family noncanonical pyrimidine nucleotidase